MTGRDRKTARTAISRLLLVLPLAALLSLQFAGRAGAASAYQINPAHDGSINLKRGLVQPIKLRWVRDLGGVVSYPLVANKMIFVTTGNHPANNGNLYALNLMTGETVWSKPMATRWSNAAYDNGRVFVVDSTGLVQAFAADGSGTRLWTLQMAASTAPPVASDGLVFVTDSYLFTLRALDEATGAVKWSAPVQYGQKSTPAIGDGGVYVTYWGQYYKFAEMTGAPLWHDDMGESGGGGATPVYHRNRVYLLDESRGNFVLDADTGEGLFPLGASQPPAFFSAPKVSIEIALANKKLFGINPKNGSIQWVFRGDGQLSSAPIVINEQVLEGLALGELYLLDAATGKRLWSRNVGQPIVQGDGPLTGLGAGNSRFVIVPAGTQLSVYAGRSH